jgi:hypothetical protein
MRPGQILGDYLSIIGRRRKERGLGMMEIINLESANLSNLTLYDTPT